MPAIPGTVPVTAPIAPTDSTSTYPATLPQYQLGGFQDWFANEGDWTNPAILPTARKQLGMWVRSLSMGSSKKWYQLDSLSPETWTAVDLTTLPTASSTAIVLNTMADLVTLCGTVSGSAIPALVFLRGYTTAGIGCGYWRYDASSTYTTNTAVKSLALAPGRFLPVFDNSRIDVTMFGAKDALVTPFDSETPVHDAFNMQQDVNWPDKVLFFPAGKYSISTTLLQNPIYRLNIEGIGCGWSQTQSTYNPNRWQGASCISMTSNDTPILKIGGSLGTVRRIALEYSNTQTTSHPNSAAFTTITGAGLFGWVFEDLDIRNDARSFYVPSTAGGCPNNKFRNIRLSGGSIQAVHFNCGGTRNEWSFGYIQCASFPNGQSVNITNVVKAGVTLTLTLSAIPTNLKVGMFVYTYGLQWGSEIQWVCKTIVGSTITVDFVSDPGGTVTVTTGTLQAKGVSVTQEPPVFIGGGAYFDFQGMDIELAQATANANVALALHVEFAYVSMQSLHVEYTTSTASNQTLVRNKGGIFTCDQLEFANLTPGVGLTMYGVTNDDSGGGGFTSISHVREMYGRDIATTGGGFVLGRAVSGAAEPIIDNWTALPTARANTTSTVTTGSLNSALRVSGRTGATALGGTGVLSVASGVLETPGTMSAASSLASRAALFTPDFFRDYRPVVGTKPANWGCQQAYSTFTQATTVSCHTLLYDVTDLQIAYSGFTMLNAFATPTEAYQNMFEILVAVAVVQSDLTTIVGAKRPVWWGNRRLYKVEPGTTVLSNIIGGYYPAGTILKVWTYVHRLKSDTTTIAGDLGVIPADQTYYPRYNNIGGSLVTNNVLGCEFSTSTTIDTTLYGKVDGATAVTIGNTAGTPPSVIIGRVVGTNAQFSAAPPVALVGMSITAGFNDLNRTDQISAGNGWAMRGFADTRPVYRSSIGGNGVQYYLDPYLYNWNERATWIKRCPVVLYDLGTNDIAGGRTDVQLEADVLAHWAILRKFGVKKIIACTILPRNTSTDGYQTTTNQTASGGVNFNTYMAAYNTWLGTQVGLSTGCDAVLDLRTAVCDANPIYWKLSTVNSTTTTTAGSTTTVINVSASLTANALIGYCALIGTQSFMISSNTTSSITVDTAYSSAPGAGVTVTILRQMTNDGVHLTTWGHVDAAALLTSNLSLFTISTPVI